MGVGLVELEHVGRVFRPKVGVLNLNDFLLDVKLLVMSPEVDELAA